MTPTTLVLGDKTGESDGGDLGRNEVLKARGEDRVSLAAIFSKGNVSSVGCFFYDYEPLPACLSLMSYPIALV